MLDRCVAIMAEQAIMPAPQARALLADVMSRLKRWRAPAERASELGALDAAGGRCRIAVP